MGTATVHLHRLSSYLTFLIRCVFSVIIILVAIIVSFAQTDFLVIRVMEGHAKVGLFVPDNYTDFVFCL